jgi:bacterioferritin-associated ferredoxin
MIICHCQNITDHDIHAAIDWMRASDHTTLITPGKIYHSLGKAADCGGCVPLFLETMRSNDNLQVPPQLRNLKPEPKEDTHYERRQKGHRISK